MADMAIEIQVERLKLADATSARDSAVQRLSSAYDSIKEKALTINRLQKEKAVLEDRVCELETERDRVLQQAQVEENEAQAQEIKSLKEKINDLTDALEAQKLSNGTMGGSQSEVTLATSGSGDHALSNRSSGVEKNASPIFRQR